MARSKGKKEKITFYAPPQISLTIQKIIETGIESSLSEAICRSITEYWIQLEKKEQIEITDDRFDEMKSEIESLNAHIQILSDRLSLVEQKYSLLTLAVGEQETEYRHKNRIRDP